MILTAGVAVHGQPHAPTWLRPDGARTINTVPLSVIATEMHRYGITVDVDVLSEGKRTSRDAYGRVYEEFLHGQPAAGQRTTTLLVSMNTAPNTPGLAFRRGPIEDAVIAAARRITNALNHAGCRAALLGPADLKQAVDIGDDTHREQWKRCRRAGRAFVTSYALTDLDRLADVWSFPADRTALRVAMRHTDDGVTISGLVRYTTPQPIPATPSGMRLLAGQQWAATCRPHDVISRVPAQPLKPEHDRGIVAGPSGVLLGKRSGTFMLLPLSDPVEATTVSVHADERAARQLLRRVVGAGETLDPARFSINNGQRGTIRIQHDGDTITVATPRFTTQLVPAEFGPEESWL